MRVRAHLALMATVIVVPIVLLSGAALAVLTRAESDAAQHGVRETARSIALAVDRELAVAETALRVLSTSRYLDVGDLEGFTRQARAARTSDTSWVILFDANAIQLMNTRFPENDGKPRANPQRVAELVKSQRADVSDIYVGASSRRPIVTVDVPVTLPDGRKFVLTQAFLPEFFNGTFLDPPLPSNWLIGIFDGTGRTIARSRRAEEFLAQPGAPKLVEAMRNNREGELRHATRDGVEVYDFYTRSRRSNWNVVVGVPADALDASAHRAVAIAAFGIVAALVGAALLALLLGRRLANAIAHTERAAAPLGRGEAPRFERSSIHEIDKLQATLAEAGALLVRERQARELAEAERARLLESEKAARQFAEAQNEAKDEFLAMLGHELRNPLSAISGAVAVMQSGDVHPDAVSYAREVISRQSGHLGRIVDDLLDMSRVMTGKIRLDMQRVDLAEAVRRCVGTLDAAGRTGRHALGVTSAPAWIDADATRLDQVISNLLVNAVKYTPDHGRIDVEVATDGNDAILKVRDTGVGIPPSLMPRIFDVFVQGAASLDRGQGGLGIGLALVHRLVTMHGGSVAAQSEGEGRGATFTVRLPLMAPPAAGVPAAAATGATRHARILLVDDHEDARKTLRMVLELLGYHAVEAEDGVAALKAAKEEPPDVAVVDIGLPGMDGYEVARRLRADPRTRDIALVALTGYGQEDDRRRALEAGFDEHLVKPVNPRDLLAAIARARKD